MCILNKKRRLCASIRLNKYPADAVCCEVLNLLSQVDPNPAASPWLRPIASRPKDEGSVWWVLAQNRECNITNTAGYVSYTTNLIHMGEVEININDLFLSEDLRLKVELRVPILGR